MRIIETENYQEMSEVLLRLFTEQIRKKPDSVLSFTTGKDAGNVFGAAGGRNQ